MKILPSDDLLPLKCSHEVMQTPKLKNQVNVNHVCESMTSTTPDKHRPRK